MAHTQIIFTLAGIGLLTLLCQWLAWWVKLPAILFLLICGIVIGPLLNWLDPPIIFGNLLIPFIQLAIAVILFEGSLTLNFEQIHEVRHVVRNLVSFGLLITAFLTTLFTHWIVHLSWELAALVGVITAVTGPTVIMPILRTVRPKPRVANILRWEGIMIDPLGAILAAVAYSFIIALKGDSGFAMVVAQLFELILTGVICGVLAGYGLGIALRRHWLPDFLRNVATLIIVLAIYTLSNQLDEGSGLLTVTIMGIWLANMRGVPVEDILGFKESLSILLISGLFIILAANVEIKRLTEILIPGSLLLLALQFIVRPLAVLACTFGAKLSWKERFIMGWIAPRGIVAAAVAALFSIRLETLNIPNSQYILLLTFFIIIGTVVWQSLTSGLMARLLKVAEPEPKGVLIIGANKAARLIAKALLQHDFRVMLASMNWDNLAAARMQGLKGYFGNPISEHADRHLDLMGIGIVACLSSHANLNALACLRYRQEFGRGAIYTLRTKTHKPDTMEKYLTSNRHHGKLLFDKSMTYSKLADQINEHTRIHSTTLTKSFDFKSYQIKHPDAITLFALNSHGDLHFFTSEMPIKPGIGWTIVSLVNDPPPDNT